MSKEKTELEIMDDWANSQTLLGTSSDKSSKTSFQQRPRLPDAELDALYEQNALAARIVNRLPDDATREGFKIVNPDVEFEEDLLFSQLEDIQAREHFGEGWKWGRLYGGSLVVVAVNDGRKFDQPMDMENITGIGGLSVIDRRWAQPDLFDPGLGSRGFANPGSYKVFVPWGRENFRNVHRSRVIRFDAFPVNPYSLIQGDGWAPSVLQRIYSTLKRLGTNRKAAEHILLHLSMFVYKMQGFKKILKQGKAAKAKAEEYFATIRESMDTLHMLVFDTDDSFDEKQMGNLGGLVQMLERSLDDLVSETDEPKSILLGETPGGLNSGENAGEIRSWYDFVRSQQKEILTSRINRLLDVIFAMWKRAGRAVPTKWTIEFDPLWQLTETEQATIRKTNAETDNMYWEQGAVTTGQIAEQRFVKGNDGALVITEEEAAAMPEMTPEGGAEGTPEPEVEAEEVESDNAIIVREIPKGETLLTAKDVATRLQMSPSTVIKMAKTGAIRCYVLPNGRYRFSWSEVAGAVSDQTLATL